MNFEKFIGWADGQVQDAVNKNKDKVFETNKRKEYLLPLVLSYLTLEQNKKLVKTTWWLMFATWILAITTKKLKLA